jgi:hypothetical protein
MKKENNSGSIRFKEAVIMLILNGISFLFGVAGVILSLICMLSP